MEMHQMTLRVASGDREFFRGSIQRKCQNLSGAGGLCGMPRSRLGPRTRTPNLSKASLKPIPSATVEPSDFQVKDSAQTKLRRATSPQPCEHH